ncbi:AraC family transcriptional regulator [Porcipelethomonas sp.]|uniref:AraC family transcriptional regulator n=1 Tax=Porcipelethomonas sp. TaxID=2981675 RepID=UPI003EF36F35
MDNSLFYDGLQKPDRILYTPTAFAKTSLIYMQETGELKAADKHISRRNNLHSYLFFIVLNGKGNIKYKNKDYIVKRGDCVFLDCHNNYYHHQSSNDLWTLKWVHFNGGNMNGIYNKYVQRGGKPCFTSSKFLEYDSLLSEIYNIAVSDTPIRDMKLYEKLVSLLTMILEECWTSDVYGKQQDSKDLILVKHYLDNNYKNKISLDELAEIFYINKFYLAKLFKKQFGVSIINYLMQVRITHAKRLLRFTDMSIERIGQECGINDPNYFARIFKKIEGISPGSFRKMW